MESGLALMPLSAELVVQSPVLWMQPRCLFLYLSEFRQSLPWETMSGWVC